MRGYYHDPYQTWSPEEQEQFRDRLTRAGFYVELNDPFTGPVDGHVARDERLFYKGGTRGATGLLRFCLKLTHFLHRALVRRIF